MYDDHDPDDYHFDPYERFRDPGGNSALHSGKRTEPCPTCGESNKLTRKDKAKGYQCDNCADMAEGGY